MEDATSLPASTHRHQTPCVPPSSRAPCSSLAPSKPTPEPKRTPAVPSTPPSSLTPASQQVKRSRSPTTSTSPRPPPKSPRTKPRSQSAILLLTDVFGLNLLQNKLLADSFARAGYLTLVPDLFAGSPAPSDINDPASANFSIPAFLAAHQPPVTDPIIASAISHLRGSLNISSIAAAGYCFGGRYALRVVNPSPGGADVAFAAHPSLLTDEEISGVEKPVSVAAADRDELLTAARRAEVEGLLLGAGGRYQVGVYGGTPHGFAVRANYSVESERFGKEGAFLQAVGWFDEFLVGRG
uniref:Carboxymethylenebutenolidase n=1 Tax=Podospora anserina (strain S / ATCC MYA-4624 / DSM 980 / FGSC 10383) TaxID=515849 RepID=A0A090DB12_PODAN|nr:Putative carboxymethylenebutenolidase [Podospora anserina S mat+]